MSEAKRPFATRINQIVCHSAAEKGEDFQHQEKYTGSYFSVPLMRKEMGKWSDILLKQKTLLFHISKIQNYLPCEVVRVNAQVVSRGMTQGEAHWSPSKVLWEKLL